MVLFKSTVLLSTRPPLESSFKNLLLAADIYTLIFMYITLSLLLLLVE